MKQLSDDAHSASVSATYEEWWSRVHDVVLQQGLSGEQDLARLIHLALAATVGDTPPGERSSILWGTKVPSPYLSSVRIVRDWIADTVIEHSQGCDAIIELGSGWGFNLFNIWLRGGPKSVPYHALIPSRKALVKMLYVAGFSQVMRYMGEVNHIDFNDSPDRRHRREIFLASRESGVFPDFVREDQSVTPKIDYSVAVAE